jgi:hypothetical protein
VGNYAQLVFAGVLTVVASAASGSDGQPLRANAAVDEAEPVRAWVAPKPDGDEEARERLATMRAAYAACRSYRDRGTVTSVSTATKREEVERFDTVFVRGVGLRFRYYEKDGPLRFGIWRRGDKTQEYFWGSARDVDVPFERTTYALQGVTNRTSSLAPNLLYGIHSDCTAHLLDTAPPCSTCVRLLSDCGVRDPDSYTVLVVDSASHAFARFESSHVIHPRKDEDDSSGITVHVQLADGSQPRFDPTPYLSEMVIAYEPEFDVADEEALRHELETPPW